MKRLKITICFLILYIFIYWIGCANLCWAVIEDQRWSFDFKNCDISDALSQITKMSGIKIIANSSINKRVADKSYKNMTLDRILSDLLRGQNCAIVWRYNERGLNSIDIWNFGQSGNVGGSVMTASNESVEPNSNTVIKSTVQSRSNAQKTNVIQVTNTSSSSNSKNNLSNSNRYSTVKNNVVSNNQAATKTTQPVSNSSGNSSGNKNRGFTSNTRKEVGNKGISSIPQKWNYLEAPPMPPGLSNVK